MRRLLALVPPALVLALAAVPAADAVVLVEGQPQSIACGAKIRTGVWWKDVGHGSRRATIQIRSSAGRVLRSWHVTAKATGWTYYRYAPRCGRTYTVRYVTASGPPYSDRVHVRSR